MPPRHSFRLRPHHAELAGILLLALVVRIFAVLDWNSLFPDSLATLHGDEPGYFNTARELLAGKGFTWPLRTPLYPAFLSVWMAIAGESLHRIRLWQCLPSVATVGLTWLLARRTVGPRGARAAALMACFSYTLIRQPINTLTEVLFTPALLAVALRIREAFRAPQWTNFAWLGFAIGLADLVRPTLVLLPVFVVAAAVWLLPVRKAALCAAACCVAAGLTILPWTIHNAVQYRTFLPLATTNAALWLASPEYYHLLHEGGYTYQRVWSDVLYGPSARTLDPSSIPGDRYWNTRGLKAIAAEPVVYLRASATRLFTYWLGDPSADWNNGRILSYRALVSYGYLPSWAIQVIVSRLVPLFALLSLWVLRRRRVELLALWLPLVYTTLFHAATHAEARLSEPFQPLLLILIAGALAGYGRLPAREGAPHEAEIGVRVPG